MLEGFEWDRRKNYAPFGSRRISMELSLAILEAQPAPAGTNKAFDFTMNAPGGEATPSGDVAQKVAGAASAVACALGALAMKTTTRRMEWKLEARADIPGVDIAKSQKVRVNLV